MVPARYGRQANFENMPIDLHPFNEVPATGHNMDVFDVDRADPKRPLR